MSGVDTRGIAVEELAPAPFPGVRHEFRVFIAEAAFDRAVQRGNENLTREIGGVLVGELCRDDGGPYIRVDATIDAAHADEQGTELTFTHDTWEHINREMDERHPDRKILGWYHTHPGFGIFLSDRDLFIHRSFFNLPFQVALVYDPKTREHGLFTWKDDEPRRSRRHWIGDREHLWEGDAPKAPVIEAKPAPKAAAPEERDWVGTLITAAIVLLLGGMAGWWIGRGSGAEEAEAARRELHTQSVLAAQQAYRTLHVELLGLLRETAGGEAIRRPLADAIADLDAGKADEARARLVRLRDDHALAEKALHELAEAGRSGSIDPRKVAAILAQQNAVLGQVCVEVAAATNDRQAARRLLMNAMRIDPGQRELYERKLRELGE